MRPQPSKITPLTLYSRSFLLLYFISLSANILGSLNVSSKVHTSGVEFVSVDCAGGGSSDSDDMAFKETELDGEDDIRPILTILPTFLSIDSLSLSLVYSYSELTPSLLKHVSIFLVTRDLRI